MEATTALIALTLVLFVVVSSLAHRIEDRDHARFLAEFAQFQQQHRRVRG